jgi:hypothetical protein
MWITTAAPQYEGHRMISGRTIRPHNVSTTNGADRVSVRPKHAFQPIQTGLCS